MKNNNSDFLLEIGTEELPASEIGHFPVQLKELFEKMLSKQLIEHGHIKAFHAPRRLVIFIEKIADYQKESTEVVAGPPKELAFNSEGKPTAQLLGFLKSKNAKMEDVKFNTKNNKDYIFLERTLKAEKTAKLLACEIPAIMAELHSAKSMIWDASGFSFSRPIRWIMCLIGNKPLIFKFGNILSSNRTYIDIFDTKGSTIKTTEAYFNKLKRNKIIIDAEQRKAEILKYSDKTLKHYRGYTCEYNKNLLAEVVNIVESPTVFVGSFDKNYLRLPGIVITVSMAKHQRIFPVILNGKLTNKFIAVINNPKASLKIVMRNYESVLEARLKDAMFFIEEDSRISFESRTEQLKNIVFLKGLGTLYDKTKRIMNIAEFLSSTLGIAKGEYSIKLKKAAGLLKVDLTTNMVGEFPSLEGIMGKLYAEQSGLDSDISEAIYEHYLPKLQEDALPKTQIGITCSIADKIDNITGCFLINAKPSGNYDPYALRRQSWAIIKIIISHKLKFSLKALILQNLNAYGKNDNKIKEEIEQFFSERCYNFFRQTYSYDLVNAVVASEWDDIYSVYDRIEQLNAIRDTQDFEKTRAVIERTNNILKGAKIKIAGNVDTNLLEHDLEKKLWDIYINGKENISKLIDSKDYKRATSEYGRLFFEPMHKLFDNVLVNAENEDIRLNRLTILDNINKLYTLKIADLSQITIEKTKKINPSTHSCLE